MYQGEKADEKKWKRGKIRETHQPKKANQKQRRQQKPSKKAKQALVCIKPFFSFVVVSLKGIAEEFVGESTYGFGFGVSFLICGHIRCGSLIHFGFSSRFLPFRPLLPFSHRVCFCFICRPIFCLRTLSVAAFVFLSTFVFSSSIPPIIHSLTLTLTNTHMKNTPLFVLLALYIYK